jgi:hypothetical protein
VEKLYRRAYSIDEDKNVTLGDDITEVKEVLEYVAVSNIKPECSCKEKHEMEKEKIVQQLIDCPRTKFADDNREWLMSLEEDQLAMLEVPEPDPPAKPDPDPEPDKVDNKDDADPPAEPPTLEEELNAMSPEHRAHVQRALAAEEAKKAGIVDALLKAKTCTFTKEELQGKEIEELQKLTELARVDADFTGAAPAVLTSPGGDVPMPEPLVPAK